MKTMTRTFGKLTLIAAATLALLLPPALADQAAGIAQAKQMIAHFEAAVNRGRSDLNGVNAERSRLIGEVEALAAARAAHVSHGRCDGRGFVGTGDGLGFNVDHAGMRAFERAAARRLQRIHELTRQRDALQAKLDRDTRLLAVWKAHLARLLK